MENKTNVINQVSYNIQEKKLTLLYDNNTTEELNLNQETYTKLFENWFTEVPMFISDKHKDIIRLLNFAKINKEAEITINKLNSYFSDTEKAKVFLNYLKQRVEKIKQEKEKWSVKK